MTCCRDRLVEAGEDAEDAVVVVVKEVMFEPSESTDVSSIMD